MRKGLVASTIALGAVLALSAHAQNAANTENATPRNPYIGSPVDGWTGQPVPKPANSRPGPAPRRDISGIWDPGNGGIQPMGARAMPEDGKPGHDLPYTPAGLAALKLSKPS